MTNRERAVQIIETTEDGKKVHRVIEEALDEAERRGFEAAKEKAYGKICSKECDCAGEIIAMQMDEK